MSQPVPDVPATVRVTRRSAYVAMPDGVRLALDVWRDATLTADAAQPCLLLSTRYWRAFDLVEGDPVLQPLHGLACRAAMHGVTVVNVDARGSGASFGQRVTEWSREERADLWHVIDWVIAQPWSDGRVMAHGYSYGGNTAFLAASTGHPALVAVAPQFADIDIYRHNLFPGGIANLWLNDNWAALTAAQDRADVAAVADALPGIDRASFLHHVRGPAPVDGPDGPALLAEAVAGHAGNFNIAATARSLVYADDAAGMNAGRAVHAVLDCAQFGVNGWQREIAAAGIPIAYWAGWFDAGTAEGALELFAGVGNPLHVTIGPWGHGRSYLQDPFAATGSDADGMPVPLPPTDNFDDVLAVLAAPPTDRRIDYFVLGANEWRTTRQWPPEGLAGHRLHLAPGRRLTDVSPAEAAHDSYQVDPAATTGKANRWWTQIGCQPVLHENRRAADARLIVHDSAPLPAPLEIVGAPVVALALACDQSDAALFVYLEMIDANGRVTLLSEGQLRLLHRKVQPADKSGAELPPVHSYARRDGATVTPGAVMDIRLRLLPIAIRLPTGTRVRLAVAGADADTFGAPLVAASSASPTRIISSAPPTLAISSAPPTFTFHYGPAIDCWLDLPITAPAAPDACSRR